MKKSTITLTLILLSNLVFSQLMDEENELIQEYKAAAQNLQFRSIGDISGFCDVNTIVTAHNLSGDWDICEGQSYEGTIKIESVNGELYNVYSENLFGDRLNDPTFGAYYACYGFDSQTDMPNSDHTAPTLYLHVSEDGALSFSGVSQWNQVYSLTNVVMDGIDLSFSWTNDYGEGADVELTRQDGQFWKSLLTPCSLESKEDSLALVALYNATDGPNWNITWDLNAPVSEWYGITVDPNTCEITEIDMGRTSQLIDLGFYGNNLVGTIPDEIGNLSELTALDLSNNQLEGEILSKIIGLLNLKYLALNTNSFSGQVIPQLSDLTNLQFISLSANEFEGELPIEIAALPNLSTFFASDNNLSGEIPREFGQLSAMRNLSIWGNKFTGSIPDELGDLQNLRTLNLDFNQLIGEIPASLAQLPFLSRLRLSFNQLSGEIPDGFPFLSVLRLNNNNLSGEVPASLSANFGIAEVNLSNNNFYGPFPSHLIQNDSIQEFYFYNNDFSGCVDHIDQLCLKPYNPIRDSVTVNNALFLASYSNGYDLSGNPKMAWEGNIQNACDSEPQIGAPCNDGDPNTTNDGIDNDCNCSPLVSTIDIPELNSLTITPNILSTGESILLTLYMNTQINAKVRIIDPNGSMVYFENLGHMNGVNYIGLENIHLMPGLYILQVATDTGVVSKKMIIQ